LCAWDCVNNFVPSLSGTDEPKSSEFCTIFVENLSEVLCLVYWLIDWLTAFILNLLFFLLREKHLQQFKVNLDRSVITSIIKKHQSSLLKMIKFSNSQKMISWSEFWLRRHLIPDPAKVQWFPSCTPVGFAGPFGQFRSIKEFSKTTPPLIPCFSEDSFYPGQHMSTHMRPDKNFKMSKRMYLIRMI